jgi:hypothetical protein
MARNKHPTLAAPPPDPFGERRRPALQHRMQLLGGQFQFQTDSARLLRIVQRAYARLPGHEFTGAIPRLLVRLTLTAPEAARSTQGEDSEPPLVRALSGDGILCGAMDSANFVAISPQRRSALVVVSPDMLRFPYHVRYEMLEFAVYVLATRAQRLVPLHAACMGRDGRGILLLGASGSGKSTVSLHGVLQGLEFLAEDSVLIRPEGLLATGVGNFLHVRPDSLRFLEAADSAAMIRRSSIIRRRSGVEKLEIDLRRPQYRLAPAPLQIAALVFVSARGAGSRALLAPMQPTQVTRQLAAGQQYAAHQPGWRAFTQRVARLPAFELRRGSHPRQAVEALESLLQPAPARAARNRASQ